MASASKEQIDAARQICYHFFSTAFSDPRYGDWSHLTSVQYRDRALAAAALLRSIAEGLGHELAPGERAPVRFDLADAWFFLEGSMEVIEREYRRIFGFLLSKDCPPYETEFCPQTFSIYRSQQMGDVAGYYKAFGLEPSRVVPERPDHIALELEFMAWVIGKEAYAGLKKGAASKQNVEVCRQAQGRFIEDHLCWWVPAFSAALVKKAEGRRVEPEEVCQTFYGTVGVALAAFVAFERLHLGIAASSEFATPQPPEDDAEMACGGCEGGDAFVEDGNSLMELRDVEENRIHG